MLKRMDAVVLFVTDLELLRSFYLDKVGLELKSEDEGFAEFSFENSTLALMTVSAARETIGEDVVAAGKPAGARQQIAVYVEDLDSEYGRLTQRGVDFLKEPTNQPWGQRTANFRDPEGNLWEVSQWLQSGDESGN